MKKIILEKQIKIKGVKNFAGKDKLIDYYIIQPGEEAIYAFSKIYTNNTYEMCKSGISVNELSTKKSRDTGIMKLVGHLNRMLPFLSDYYELPTIAS